MTVRSAARKSSFSWSRLFAPNHLCVDKLRVNCDVYFHCCCCFISRSSQFANMSTVWWLTGITVRLTAGCTPNITPVILCYPGANQASPCLASKIRKGWLQPLMCYILFSPATVLHLCCSSFLNIVSVSLNICGCFSIILLASFILCVVNNLHWS